MSSEPLLLTNAQVISLDVAGTLWRGYLRIADGCIQALGPMEELSSEPDGRIIDLSGRTLLPGLIDSHCHLISETEYPVSEPYLVRSTVAGVRAARLALEAGLTSVRDVGCRHLGIYALRSAVLAGEVPGPRFQTAGRPIAGTGIMQTWRSHSHDGPDEMLRGVRREWQEGAHWVKVSVSDGRWRDTRGWRDTPLVTEAELQTLVTEAHNKDMRVVCHVDGPQGAQLAVAVGVDSIEHGVHIPDQLLDQMAELRIAFVPTVWIYSTQDLKVFRADLDYLNELHAETIQRARRAGVSIAAGVDFSYAKCPPLEGMVNELEALVSRGLTVSEALEAATIRGARLLGWADHIGSLAPGKQADLVVVDGDPLTNLTDLRRIPLVIQGGRIVSNRIDGQATSETAALQDWIPAWMA